MERIKHFFCKIFVIFVFFLISSELLQANNDIPDNYSVLIINGKNINAFVTAQNSIVISLRRYSNKIKIFKIDLWKNKKLKLPENVRPDLIFTIGTTATEKAYSKFKSVTIVFSMVLSPSRYLKKASNIKGVMLDIPVVKYFQKFRQISSKKKRIGVLYNPEENQFYVMKAAKIAKINGFILLPYPVISAEELPRLDRMRVDAIWLIADKVICQRSILQKLLLKSIQQKKIVIGLSPSYTRAGALFSLSTDYSDIGAQAAEMGIRLIQGTLPDKIKIESPRKILFYINIAVAKRLGIHLNKELIKQADGVFGQ